MACLILIVWDCTLSAAQNSHLWKGQLMMLVYTKHNNPANSFLESVLFFHWLKKSQEVTINSKSVSFAGNCMWFITNQLPERDLKPCSKTSWKETYHLSRISFPLRHMKWEQWQLGNENYCVAYQTALFWGFLNWTPGRSWTLHALLALKRIC